MHMIKTMIKYIDIKDIKQLIKTRAALNQLEMNNICDLNYC